MNAEQIDQFERIQTQLEGLYNEIGTLSKKKPDDAINNFKLGFVNQVIEQANQLLGKEGQPFADFEQFDVDSLPTNSDVVLILAQYLNRLEKLREKNIKKSFDSWYWVIDGKQSERRAGPPRLWN